MFKYVLCLIGFLSFKVDASNIIPLGHDNTVLYYKLGGDSDFNLPPVSDTTTIHLDSASQLGLGESCSAFNPALSITNSINDLKDSADNLEQSIISNATGSLIQLPMYLLAQANPTAYHLLNNALTEAHNKLSISTKSCELVKSQIANGKNPYQDWGTLAVNDQWKKHLSFVAAGQEDINDTKKFIDTHHGEEGLPWIENKNAGGKDQPPIHVLSDTVKVGYNAILNRDLQSNDPAPDSELKNYFANPKQAVLWITNVLGDQVITTCLTDTCQKQQGSFVGHGLLPWLTSCENNQDNCVSNIREQLSQLIHGSEPLTKKNLLKVSASGIAMSPDIIVAIRSMNDTEQSLMMNKLAEDIAMQKIIDKSFMARRILSAGSEVPVIAANHPAEVLIDRAISHLDFDIRSLVFESDIRKNAMSGTISQILQYSKQNQQKMMHIQPESSEKLMQDSAFQQESA